MSEETKEIENGLFAQALIEKKMKVKSLGSNASGVEMIEMEAGDLVQVCKDLKRSHKMGFLNYMTAVELKDGLQSIIQIENHEKDFRNPEHALVIKVTVPKDKANIPSLTDVYPNADWFEREAYDMIGINYEGHANLVRILNPDDWQGHPLRKDYLGPIDELNQPLKF